MCDREKEKDCFSSCKQGEGSEGTKDCTDNDLSSSEQDDCIKVCRDKCCEWEEEDESRQEPLTPSPTKGPTASPTKPPTMGESKDEPAGPPPTNPPTPSPTRTPTSSPTANPTAKKECTTTMNVSYMTFSHMCISIKYISCTFLCTCTLLHRIPFTDRCPLHNFYLRECANIYLFLRHIHCIIVLSFNTSG